MLPEAVREWYHAVSHGTVNLPPFVNPFLLFCLGYITVYAVEGQSQPDSGDAKLHKHSVLAMVQRAGAEKASASVCVVEVPPVTTYHSDGGPAGKASPLVSHQAPPITRLGSGSYGHHRTPSFGHEHTHQQHEHSFPEPARIGVPRVASGDHAHSHNERGATPPMGTFAKAQKWEDEESCCGCETGDHDHVHRGVMHKHIVVVGGVAPELTPLMPLIYALLFSVHSLIAGLALGVQAKLGAAAMAILIAIVAHKFVEALSLAASFVREGVRLDTSLAVLMVYCAMTPLGIGLGACVVGRAGSATTAVEAMLSSFAAGSFCFLAAHELGSHDHKTELNRLARAALALTGVLLMGLVSLFA